MAESRTQFHKYATMEGHEPRSMTQKEYEGNLKRLEVLNSISEYECSANFWFIQHITIGALPANVEMLLLGGFNKVVSPRCGTRLLFRFNGAGRLRLRRTNEQKPSLLLRTTRRTTHRVAGTDARRSEIYRREIRSVAAVAFSRGDH